MNGSTSVVIPTKNRAHLLPVSVASVQAQSLALTEMVIVDDGSQDDTPAVLKKLAASDPRIKILRFEKSVGAAAARNAGIAATSAEWVMFLDSDDRWHAEKHARQMARLQRDPHALASFTGYFFVEGDNRIAHHAPSCVTLNDLRGENVVGMTSTAMVRRATLQAVGGFDAALPSCQDWDLWLKLRAVGDFAMVEESLLDFVVDSNDRISRNSSAVVAGHRIVFERALEDVPDWPTRRRIVAKQNLRLATIFDYEMPDPRKRLVHALKALLAWPERETLRAFYRAIRSLLQKRKSVG